MGLPLGIYTNHYGKGCGKNNKDCRGMDQVRGRGGGGGGGRGGGGGGGGVFVCWWPENVDLIDLFGSKSVTYSSGQ